MPVLGFNCEDMRILARDEKNSVAWSKRCSSCTNSLGTIPGLVITQVCHESKIQWKPEVQRCQLEELLREAHFVKGSFRGEGIDCSSVLPLIYTKLRNNRHVD